MTSSATRNLRRYDPVQHPLSYGAYYSNQNLWDRLSQPSFLLPVLLLLLTAGYQFAQNQAVSRGRQLPNIGRIIWDAVVFFCPASFLYAVDRWVNPPLFPNPMLEPQPTTHAAKSDVLRKILQVDQAGGIVASVSAAGRRTLSSTFSSSRAKSSQPAGLGNWDNSCFQNSILQGLASLQHLPRYLISFTTPGSSPVNDETTTAGALSSFVSELNDPSNNGKTLYTPSVLKNMSTIQQQDAQEYFSKLMDRIDKDIEVAAKAAWRQAGFEADVNKDDTAASQHSDDSGYQSLPILSKAGSELVTIRNPLEGLSAQRVACMSCGHSEGLSMIPFNCLTLNFEIGVSHYDLFELLDNLVRLEPIQGVECVKCTLLEYRKGLQRLAKTVPAALGRLASVERVLEEEEFDDKVLKELKIPDSKKVSSTKTKQAVIGRPPASLVMHMNRSVFDPNTFRSYKNLAAVEFPMTLDLGPWCIGSAEGKPAAVAATSQDFDCQENDTDMEQWVLDARASMVAGDAHPSKISGPIYELRAVVTHYGRHENGHYVCYKRGHTGIQNTEKVGEDADRPPTLVGDDASESIGRLNETRLDDANPPADTEEIYSEGSGSQWWRLSDETVIKVSEQDVLSQGGVFMLFYDCVDPNSVLVMPHEPTETETPAEDTQSAAEDTQSAAEDTQSAAEDTQSVAEDSDCKSPLWPDKSAGTLCTSPAEPMQTIRTDSQASPATLFGILSA